MKVIEMLYHFGLVANFQIFFVCFAFGPANYPRMSSCEIFLSINGCEKRLLTATPIDADELSDDLWIFSLSNYELQKRLNESNPSELNYVEVICEIKDRLVVMDWVKNHPRRWGVRVECICCSQKSDVLHLPSPSARNNCCGSGMDQWAVNNGGDSGHLCGRQRRNHRPTYARRRQKHYLSHFGWFRIRFRLWKRSSRPTLPTATLMSRYLLFYYSLSLFGKSKKMKQTSSLCVFFLGNSRAPREMEEDSGLSMAHSYFNDVSNSKLYPPSKKARKS